ncbi:Maf-like protein [Salinisphaera dokdonensis CL-ES53]|uniref:Nucleoside triphosphate pyrophosphatase n=1 Tax=Salinisphaera dokdonensis CL-ES53 TaxID=1304272 RepID=A0ABV2AZ35_9GAMM
MTRTIVLASSSPQRARLLAQLGLTHETIAADIDETPREGEPAEALAERLARGKAEAIAHEQRDALVLGSDTVVALGERLYGKPRDDADADRMLASLSGQTHRVVSGVALCTGGRTVSRVAISEVSMREISAGERAGYIASGEPMGKAGGYAIQGLGAVFIARLDGSYSSVMGLPLFETAALLRDAGIDVLPSS